MKNFVFVSAKPWHDDIFSALSKRSDENWVRISSEPEFSPENIQSLNPDLVFVAHWSKIIPESIFGNFECIVFHMTDLPYGRGGSPLQNLILEGHNETKITAIKVEKGLDTGPIYLKKDLTLEGSAHDIFERSAPIIYEMIVEIIETNPTSIPQSGEISTFKRRTPEQSRLSDLPSIKLWYDYIRMLDCEGYPPAYIEFEGFKLVFSKAELIDQTLSAHVTITKS